MWSGSAAKIVCALAFWLAANAMADEKLTETLPPLQYIFNAATEVDSDNGSGLYLAFNYAFNDYTWLNFFAGGTRGLQSQAQIDTRSFGLGISHDVGTGGVSASLDTWGDPDELERDSVSVRPFIRRGPWKLSFIGELREFKIVARFPLTMEEREFDVNSNGGGLGLTYTAPRWSFFAEGLVYDYSRNPAGLDSRLALELLSASALTLTNSFIDYQARIATEFRFRLSSVYVSTTRFESAVDGAISDLLNIEFTTPVGDFTDVTINIGTTQTQGFEETTFIGVGFTYFGF